MLGILSIWWTIDFKLFFFILSLLVYLDLYASMLWLGWPSSLCISVNVCFFSWLWVWSQLSHGTSFITMLSGITSTGSYLFLLCSTFVFESGCNADFIQVFAVIMDLLMLVVPARMGFLGHFFMVFYTDWSSLTLHCYYPIRETQQTGQNKEGLWYRWHGWQHCVA